MPLSILSKIYLVAILLGTYLVQTSLLIDKFHVSRFIFVSALNLLGSVLIIPKAKAIRLQLFDLLLFCFYGLHLVSLSWSLNFAEAIFTAQKSFLLFLSYLIFRLILEKNKSAQKWVAYIVWGLSLLVLLVTSIQMYQIGSDKGLDGKVIYELVGWAGHKNLVASYTFFLFSYLAYSYSFIKQKKLLLLTMIWQFAIILLLRSRAVYVGLFSFSIIVGAYYLWQNSDSRKLIFYRLFPALITLGFIAVLMANTTDVGKTYLKYLNPTTYQQSASAIERQFVWHKTQDLIKDYPLLGCGSGNWKILFPSKSIQGGFRLQEKGLVFTRPHNDFLEVWSELGIIGGLIYFGLFIFCLLALFMSIRQSTDKNKNARMVCLGACLLAYAINAFFDFPKERIEHQVFLALLFAAILMECKQFVQHSWPSVKLSKKQKLILVVALFLAWSPNVPVSWGRALGDHYTIRLFEAKTRNNAKQLKSFSNKIPAPWYTVDPITLPIKWYEGLGYYFEQDYSSALTKFEQAYEINPYNFHVINNYASTLVQLNQFEESIPYFKQALEINPKFESGLFNLSFAYYNIGQFEEALIWAEKTSSDPEKKKTFIQQIKAQLKKE